MLACRQPHCFCRKSQWRRGVERDATGARENLPGRIRPGLRGSSSIPISGFTKRASVLYTERDGRVAQLVEQCPFKAWVAGSNPAALTKISKALIGFRQG